jgi:uncharacterized repeat protein (TIGR03806 family)
LEGIFKLMKKNYLFPLLLLFIGFVLDSCSGSDSEGEAAPVSPVLVNLAEVPYQKLSDYKFFEGELKNQQPSLNVLPFQPSSMLFTDYAHKKRFVWMPPGTKATYNSDNTILDLPVGAALIKTFYYENVQNILPAGGTRIVETRVMIRKATGWIFAEYVWNDEQTEAFYDMSGSFTDISWKDENNVVKNASYRIPSEEQCIVCHKARLIVGANEETIHIPIGIKPQNLNFNYDYGSVTKNQLTKWVEMGYLEDGFNYPTEEHTVADYNDTSKSLDVRARSYVDANCSHCHGVDRHCDYRPMRFAFSETANNPANMGACVDTEDMQGFPSALSRIVTPGNINRSMMYYRLNTIDEAYRMPLHGRTIIHEEGLALIEAWINSLEPCQ